ncbi:Syntaxin 6, N-terminal [Parasponia andersonii]|uniref:Syntaxin 6, N-terminal n=1 Tax=Parasponia andersonii TaxID=3476 RepID=A0A2P5B0V9_PARAD|nr:Syntaxin 6, N-terminal [Parasponia andersonii]
MAPSLHQWESDPLFSAAEVVQDSADRMESLFRLLLHELSPVQGDHSDPKLLSSIDFHRRDLATILETTKWQLEDFQRAVSLLAITGKSQMKEDVISRHRQFIQAIREQIIHVEKSLEDASLGNPVRNNEWVNLNEEDRDGLALFLSGGGPSERSDSYALRDSGILRRYLDSTAVTSANDGTLQNAEHKSKELETLNIDGLVHMDHNVDPRKENNLRKVRSYFSTRLDIQAINSLPEASRNGCGEDGSWDLEAGEAKPKSFSQEDKWRRFQSRMNVFGFFSNSWTAYGSRFARNYTKRLKDGEEQRDSPSSAEPLNDENWLGICWARYQRSRNYIQLNRHAIQLISFIILVLIILCKFVLQIV